MKKFLIAVICIIPVIVILALSATSDIILNFAPVNPESIVVKDSSNVEISTDTLIMASTDTGDFLIIEIYPSITPDKSIIYEQVEGTTASIDLVQQGDSNRYDIVASGAGAVSIIVRAAKNINVQVQLNFYVRSTKVTALTVYDDLGNYVESVDNANDSVGLDPYRLSFPTRFVCNAHPIDALDEDHAPEWDVTYGEDLVTVENGIVRPLKRQSGDGNTVAIIRVGLYDKDVNLHQRYFCVDVSGALASENTVRVESADDLENAVRGIILVTATDLNFSYDAETGTVFGSYTYIDEDETEQTVEFDFPLNVVIGGAEWGFIDGLSTVYTNNGSYFVGFGTYGGAAFGEEANTQISLTSSDPNILSVRLSEGRWKLSPLKAGVVTLTAVYNGETVEKQIVVRERPLVIFQDLVTADARLGIRMDRTWGTEWVKTENDVTFYTSDFRMGIRGDTNAFDVLWTATVTDFEGGTVNVAPAYGGTEPTDEQPAPIGAEEYVRLIPAGDGTQAVIMRLNPQKMLGATMTLTASVLVDNRAIDTVTASFTFKFHDIPAVNVYDWYQMRYVVDATVQACKDNAAEEGRDVILQSDVRVPDEELTKITDVNSNAIHLRSGITGNGFLFSMNVIAPTDARSVFTIHNPDYHFMKGRTDIYGETYDKGIVIEDLRVRGYDSMEVLTEQCAKGKGSYFFLSSFGNEKLTYRYCQVFNCVKALHAHGCPELTIEGCILGDNYNTNLEASYMTTDGNKKLILKNNVFKATYGPSLLIGPRLMGNMATEIAPTIEIIGTMDIYNWKTREQVGSSFATVVGSMMSRYIAALGETIFSSLINGIANAVGSAIENDTFDDLFFNYGGEEYIAFGIVELGLICPAPVLGEDITIDPASGVIQSRMKMTDENGSTMGDMATLEILIDIIKSAVPDLSQMSISNDIIIVCPDFSTGAPNIMPGEQVPNDRELYDRLTGKA